MKRRTLFLLITCATLAGGLLSPALAEKKARKEKSSPTLTAAETKDLLLMREEEKLARDVYLTLYAEWGLRPFNNISKAEQHHMDVMLGLLEKYGLEDPTLDMGEFSNPELQKLFDQLVDQGLKSKLDAVKVGALVEEVDIKDLIAAKRRTKKADLRSVYKNLHAASERHLNAFVWHVEAISGEPYTAQHLSQKKVDRILDR